MLYRNKDICYWTRVSTNWNIDDVGNGIIKTEFLPVGLVKQMDFDLDEEDIKKHSISMKYLSDLSSDSVELKTEAILQLLTAYEKWIDRIKNSISKDLTIYEPVLKTKAYEHINDCIESLDRMLYGLNLLKQIEMA